MDEIWKPVPGVDGYEVSDTAKVRCRLTGRVNELEPQVLASGYKSVPLSVGGKTRHRRLHLLVLGAFAGPPAGDQVCQFRDGDRLNCVLTNLFWGPKTCEQVKADAAKNKTAAGQVVGRFEALASAGYPGGSHTLHWRVKCLRCDSEYVTPGQTFRNGAVKCDRCDYPRFPPEQLTTAEQVERGPVRKLREYKKWLDAKNRCKNRSGYRDRGVRVCDPWASDFVRFFRDAGPQPGPDFVLDRFPDGAGDYEPGNVRWATPRQSNENRGRATPTT